MSLELRFEVIQSAVCCFIIILVNGQFQKIKNETIYVKHHNVSIDHILEKHKQVETKPTETPEQTGHYTFVALIEIMFNDGSRRNCTGTIIHDNVVITAAHCFDDENTTSLQPELTGSFVIIGTKRMFDTGYEQYLPIERVLIHPDFSGWTADLALVYTFAGMMSDKPGIIIPLAGENLFTSTHSNVTVINWNQMKKPATTTTTKSWDQDSCSASDEEEDKYFPSGMTRPILVKSNHGSSHEDATSTTTATNFYENLLNMANYTIFEVHACKHLVQKSKPPMYQIVDENKTLCYFTKSPNIAQGNAGAPSLYRNHLVSIAAGELENDFEHIIVATKVSCYCSWIAENLPGGGDHLQCCNNCCVASNLGKKPESFFKR